MKKISFLLISLVFLSLTSFGEEIPVNIKAEKLKYSEKTNLLTASGNVRIELKEVVIFSDDLIMDSNSQVVTAEGNVTIELKDYSAKSNTLTYHVSSETSVFENFSSELRPGNIKGSLYVKSQNLNDLKEKMLGDTSSITTCSHAGEGKQPHYLLEAQKIEYYPDDKIIGYHVFLYQQYIGSCPVMYTPYLVYDLKRKRKRNWVFGHNEVEGYFIKSTWDQPTGLLYLDYMEKKGPGYGILHEYTWKKQPGDIYLYHVQEEDNVIKWNQKFKLGGTDFGLTHNYSNMYLIPSGRIHQTFDQLDFEVEDSGKTTGYINNLNSESGNLEKQIFKIDRTAGDLKADYFYQADRPKTQAWKIQNSQKFNFSNKIANDLRFQGNIDYYKTKPDQYLYFDERMHPEVNLNYEKSGIKARITQNWYLDLDEDKYQGDNLYSFLEKQPEIELTFSPTEVSSFALTPTLGYGQYHEVKYVSSLNNVRDFYTSKLNLGLNANSNLPLTLILSTFSLNYNLIQNLYGPGDALYSFSQNYSLRTEPVSFFENIVDYKKGESEGNSPFFFDQMETKFNYLNEKARFFYEDKFEFITECGYNYETYKYADLLTSLLLKPSKILYLRVKTGYDIEEEKYLDLSTTLSLRPIEQFGLDFESVYDMNVGLFKSAHSLLILEIGDEENWQNHYNIKLGHVYDPNSREYKLVDVEIVKDLHCIELTYRYSDYRKEYSVFLTIKALPDEPVGFIEGRGFYFESLEREMSEFEAESPKRY